jgi:hypothetical protein
VGRTTPSRAGVAVTPHPQKRHGKRTESHGTIGNLGGVATFIVGFVVGASLAALLIIVIAPSRRVRAEQPMEREDVTRLLLGQDPDDATIPPDTSDEHPRAYDASELQALRRIGQARASGRRRR